MKKLLFFLFVLLLNSYQVSAQQKMVIRMTNGETKEIYLWDIDRIFYEKDNSVVVPYKPMNGVDLGLSVLWAPVNIGATTETEKGWTVGWGDVTGKNKSTNLSFFPTETPQPYIVASTEWDIATVLWQGKWRMPTDAEIKELIASCEWVRQDNGWLVKSKSSTASIFLPDVTKQANGKDVADGVTGYWTGMLSRENDKARALTFSANNIIGIDSLARYTSLAVRPVYGDYKFGVTITDKSVYNSTTSSADIAYTVVGDLSDIFDVTLCYSASPIYVAKIDDKSTTKKTIDVTAQEGETEINISSSLSGLDFYTTYYYYLCVETSIGAFYSDIKTFKTKANYTVPEELGLDAVDLGLESGTMWAPFNMGASGVADCLGFYGWGDASGQLTSTDNKTYGPQSIICNIAKTEYDIATYQWKNGWYTPSADQFKELYENCSKEWQANYQGQNVYGWKFTGPNGNSIFIPASGFYNGSTLQRQWSDAYFWTSRQSEFGLSYYVGFNDGFFQADHLDKYYHLNIRPVKDGGKPSGGGDTPSGGDDTPSGGDDTPSGGDDTPSGGDDTPSGGDDTPEQAAAGNAVDLGLSVLWADRNVGATSVDSYGTYLGWGELEHSNSTYYRTDYQYLITDNGANSVYNSLGLDEVNTSFTGNPLYDVASKEWGGGWRMPTEEEVNEMLSTCTITFGQKGSVNGYVVTGNGQSIFLPAGGRYYDDDQFGLSYLEGSIASYWTSSYYYLLVGNHPTNHDWCYCFEISKDDIPIKAVPDYRYFGRLIRPVKSKK